MSWANNPSDDNPFVQSNEPSYQPPSLPSADPNVPSWAAQPTTLTQTSSEQSSSLLSDPQATTDPFMTSSGHVPAPATPPPPAPVPQPKLQSADSKLNDYGNANSYQTTDKATDDLPRLILLMRLYNMGISIFMVFAAFTSLLTDDFARAVLAVYVMCFATLLCCFETHLKAVSMSIAQNCGFMYNAKGRVFFMVFVSLLCFSQGLLGKIAGCLMLANALFSFYIMFKHPEYEDMQKKYGTESADTIAARSGMNYARENPEVMQRGVNAGVDWAKENPEQAIGAASWAHHNQSNLPAVTSV
ncbi:hypothetical protein TrLO_g11547 [Triparma laevis f. longispina]|uniref:Uncharacterized protein n=1 Tax=Triparma laevis f. longispina TaxID=1714387 RepID=A0A9W7CDB6_9STRA|nr:hypothetical protein TrLO_g11547 [Triparma laevis f. longispina]